MQVLGNIAETGEIHFLRSQLLSHHRLQREYRVHEGVAVGFAQVSEFLDVLVPDNAAKSAIGSTIGSRHPHDAPFFSAHNQFAAVAVAKFTSCHHLIWLPHDGFALRRAGERSGSKCVGHRGVVGVAEVQRERSGRHYL